MSPYKFRRLGVKKTIGPTNSIELKNSIFFTDRITFGGHCKRSYFQKTIFSQKNGIGNYSM